VHAQRHVTERFCLLRRCLNGAFALIAVAISPAWQAARASTTIVPSEIAGPISASANVDRIVARLKNNLSGEMLGNFHLFLYVDKADGGPFAQRMYVFQQEAGGDLTLLYNWPVSTGREQLEPDIHGQTQLSLTPGGFYEFDPQRFYVDYNSAQWDEPMPFAMFFNWKPGGRDTGLAIHAAADDGVSELGKRASAGCIRLAPENAQVLFALVRAQPREPTPMLAYRPSADVTSSDGLLLHDQDGRLQLADNYPVLVFVEDYRGEDQISSLSTGPGNIVAVETPTR